MAKTHTVANATPDNAITQKLGIWSETLAAKIVSFLTSAKIGNLAPRYRVAFASILNGTAIGVPVRDSQNAPTVERSWNVIPATQTTDGTPILEVNHRLTDAADVAFNVLQAFLFERAHRENPEVKRSSKEFKALLRTAGIDPKAKAPFAADTKDENERAAGLALIAAIKVMAADPLPAGSFVAPPRKATEQRLCTVEFSTPAVVEGVKDARKITKLNMTFQTAIDLVPHFGGRGAKVLSVTFPTLETRDKHAGSFKDGILIKVKDSKDANKDTRNEAQAAAA